MGDSGQGTVLPSQVQGVKQGTGVIISTDGTISFDGDTASGVIRTNNPAAYNSYVWPGSGGVAATFLSINGSGVLSWNPPSIGSVVTVGAQPAEQVVGRLWFDPSTRNLKIFESISSPSGQWTPVSQGLPVTTVSASPAFTGGTGTEASPFICPTASTTSGGFCRSTIITITGLAPYQYVPMTDVFQAQNNYRFRPSNNFADGNGALSFSIYFQDLPPTASGTSYGSKYRVGFGSIYVSFGASIGGSLSLDGPGSISGTPQVGQPLTYIPGVASGGFPPYTYTWKWISQIDNSVVQTNGALLTIPSSLANGRVFVELTATDSALSSVTASTAGYPLSPLVIGRGPFPNTDILYPSTIPGQISTLWLDTSMSLEASGCILFKVGAGAFSQGPTSIANGDTITTKWDDTVTGTCADSITGTVISGCIFSTDYQDCGSLTIDRIPSPFNFLPVSDIVPLQVGTSQIITPMGYNSKAYVSYSGTSTATSVQASINGGAFANLPTFGLNTTPIEPGQTLQVRATSGSNPSSPYTAIVNIGQGSSVQSSTFTINTAASGNFTTSIPFPVTTIDVPAAVTWLAGDGATTLTSTGCIEFSVNAGAFNQGPTPITTGDTITTRWNSGGTCGGAAHGTTITGTVTNVPAGGTKTSNASLTIDRVPASFSFTNLTNQGTVAIVTSNVLNIVGNNAPSYVTYSAPPSGASLTTVEASVGGGAWTAIPSSGTSLFINPVVSGPGVTLQIRGTTGASNNTAYGVTINAGENTSIQNTVWTATTAAVVPGVVTPSILTPVNGATNLTPFSSSPAGITITSSPYTPINGASATHASTDWEIRKGSTGGTIVVNTTSVIQKTSYFLDSSSIDPNSAYFVRARYSSGDVVPVVSSWSTWSQFNTATNFSLTWVERVPDSGTEDHIFGVTWVGETVNKFVGVGVNSNTGARLCKVSSNGITWGNGNTSSLPSSNIIFNVATGFGPSAGSVVAVGQNGSIRKSTDGGASWTVPGSTNTGKYLKALVCNPSGVWVAGGGDGVIRRTTNLGVTWSAVTSPVGYEVTCFIWDNVNLRFVGTSSNGYNISTNRIITSPDGITWTVASSNITSIGFPIGQILFSPGSLFLPSRYIILPFFDIPTYEGDNPYQAYAVSTNLTSWSAVSVGDTVNAGVVGNGFIAISGYNQATASDTIFSSLRTDNPFNFVPNYSLPYDGGVYCMAYSPTLDRYVAMGDDGYIYSTS